MPPRVRLQLSRRSLWSQKQQQATSCYCQYATAAAAASATTPAPPISQMPPPITPISRFPPSQPPSHRPATYRKSQLLRSYVSLLQSTPLILLFQHSNLTANEWSAIRRELTSALDKLDQSLCADGRESSAVGSRIKLETIRTNIFEPALRITEYYKPPSPLPSPSSSTEAKMYSQPGLTPLQPDSTLTHCLSESAYRAVLKKKGKHPLSPLLTGSLAMLTMPTVSPQHLKAALQILAPQAPGFPAPKRKANPGYWDPSVQQGVKKLMLLGARVEGKAFDVDDARWVGTIDGGIDGLRAQLVYMLQGVGAGITGALEGASRSLYFTIESRRQMLEDETKPKDGEAEEAKPE